MTDIVNEIACSHCGAPLSVKPGEILVTCKYCGFTSEIETGRPYEFEHSLIANRYSNMQIRDLVKNWMKGTFSAPRDLASKASVSESELFYLPIWVVVATAHSQCKGVFERISPPITTEWSLDNRYEWLVLARRGSNFPARSYEIPLEAKTPYDFAKIERGAKVLNAELGSAEATEIAKNEIRNLHQFLSKEKVDRIIEMTTDFDVKSTLYLHGPVWFVSYDYKGTRYKVLLDGATGQMIKGDLPASEFRIL